MADVLQPEDHRQIADIVSGLDDSNFLGLQIDGVPVGRYALYELILHRKKNDLNLTEDEWRE